MVTDKFIQYKNNYKLGRWTTPVDPRIQFSILGEVEDQYIVFHHDNMVFGSLLKRHTIIIDNSKDVNFCKGWCIRKKGVDHHVHNFITEMENAANYSLVQ